MSENSVKFFSEVDMKTVNGKMKVASEYPLWYFDHVRDELEESIRQNEYVLENDKGLTKDRRMEIKSQLERLSVKLEEIREGISPLSSTQKDTLNKARKDLEKALKENMYTRNAERKGLVRAEKVAKQMIEPFIKLSPEACQVAQDIGIKLSGDMVNMNDAQRAWKIVSKRLDEDSNVEILRKD